MATKGVKQAKQNASSGEQARTVAPEIEQSSFIFDAALSTAVKAKRQASVRETASQRALSRRICSTR